MIFCSNLVHDYRFTLPSGPLKKKLVTPDLGLCKHANSDKYVSVIVSTKIQFESRFCDMKNQIDKFDLFAMPFSVDVNTAPLRCKWK